MTGFCLSLRDENKVAVIDTAARQVLGRIDVGRSPSQVFATPDEGSIYVANRGTREDPADTVSVIDVATGSVVETIRTGVAHIASLFAAKGDTCLSPTSLPEQFR